MAEMLNGAGVKLRERLVDGAVCRSIVGGPRVVMALAMPSGYRSSVFDILPPPPTGSGGPKARRTAAGAGDGGGAALTAMSSRCAIISCRTLAVLARGGEELATAVQRRPLV